MSEKDLDQLLDQIGRDPVEVHWAGPDAVRRRGRQLAYRRMAVSTGAIVLVIAMTAGTGLALLRSDSRGPNDPGATTPAATSPAPTTPDGSPSPTPNAPPQRLRQAGDPIPLRAMLQPEDLGSGWREIVMEGSDRSLDFALGHHCEVTGRNEPTIVQNRYREFSRGGGGGGSLLQGMHAYSSSEAGALWLADLRDAVERCRASGKLAMSVIDSGLPGSDSLLVREGSGDSVSYWGFVRRGDVGTGISPEHNANEARARELMTRAVRRMAALDQVKAIPREVLLEPGELGAGVRTERDDAYHPGLSARLWWCASDWPLVPDRLIADRQRTFAAPGPAGATTTPEHGVLEVDAESATQHMAALRTVLVRCARYVHGGSDTQVEILDQRFAGVDALLIKMTTTSSGRPPTTSTGHFVVVRQGRYILELELADSFAAQARQLARAAVRRLCDATDAC